MYLFSVQYTEGPSQMTANNQMKNKILLNKLYNGVCYDMLDQVYMVTSEGCKEKSIAVYLNYQEFYKQHTSKLNSCTT